ncbi:HNH endonuclease [Oligoflexus tunisiensis]|uniref:HNH endonuclease n=1 Tax=Oligoflexus tunisiensis TaxID=708132 RepID=UPI00114CCF79|nr:HNH endonuclease [Oligoflexus tunisiensis]
MTRKLKRTKDKSVIDSNGRIIFFSIERFMKDIVEGSCCFVCGASPDSKVFNDEHVLPNWILKKYELHDKYITLTNQTKLKYGSYVIPCCKDCNTDMGRMIEEPIRNILLKGYDEVVKHIEKNGIMLFYVWMALIFTKTHLKVTLTPKNPPAKS